MQVLIVYYSRTGHTAGLADALAAEARRRGHAVTVERIRAQREWNKWLLPVPLLPLLPLLPVYLLSARFRRFWHRIYHQPEQAIRPLAVPDVSNFDLVLLGTPKWLYLAYPVARWLNTIAGLDSKRVASFATFCGPPLEVFELGMLFEPLEAHLRACGTIVAGRLAISSGYHPYFFFGEMQRLFRWIALKAFGRPLADFTLDGEIGRAEFQRFCDEVLA
ncbi:MAG: flavodoxin family protein [Hydrogenophilaceae bacterium]|nr:flavodoxin family protein [Hydrogenophilaceae bacterium]